ncbi:DUF2461 domain-containing protein [Sulfitobacter sp. D35]|uniref:DUF2461 domain-containing protein n=1 Tax=Sulfitobacter sp. D35 TaxID=3083252 RepID=UPI00296E57E3|nr:DUF2461 domain-containing protein [Sulfitobacter sp. D35]MDW4500450.1 DUF2461 domain-containing protein [Sulfitobacter sp. D35]
MAQFSETSFEILGALAQNNSKEWYDANRARLQEDARAPFADLLERVTLRLEGSRYPLIGSAKTMFRQNRDIRFSKDKTPYKTTVSGMLTRSGTKFDTGGLVYAQIDVEGGMIAAGFYKLAGPELGAMREAILRDAERFARIRSDLEARGLALGTEDRLKSMPRGYADKADHPQADALRLKSFILREDVPKPAWISGEIVERLAAFVETVGPLLDFGRDAIAAKP